MERITVGIDAESASERALEWVIQRAQDRAVTIRLVTAFDMLITDPLADRRRLEELRHRILGDAPGTPVEIALVDGSITSVLTEASAWSDLLVVGFHRSRAVRSIITGAVSLRVAARSHCATVIVPDDWSVSRGGRVVAGVGDDDSAQRALEWAAREATSPRRQLDIVHAWHVPPPSLSEIPSLLQTAEELRQVHRDVLGKAVAPIRRDHPALQIREDLAEGQTVRAILGLLDDASLLVLGTHRRSPGAGLLLGSVALELLPHSRVPTCIVPLVAPLTPVAGQLEAAFALD